MTETKLQRSIIVALRALGFWVIRLQSSGRRGARSLGNGEPGLPDLYLVGLGHLEVKLPGRALSDEQNRWHARARKAGVRVWTVDSVGEAVRVAREWRTEVGLERRTA
jgi:hypothetical protein